MAKNKINRLPETLDLALYAGDGVSIRLSLGNAAGDPVNITGDVTAQIRTARKATDVSADFATLFDSGTNTVVISLTGEQTAELVSGIEGDVFKGVWDLQWSPDGGEPSTLLQGEVTCNADVTR